jgi:hypothetical protein
MSMPVANEAPVATLSSLYLSSTSNAPPLRVGLIISAGELPPPAAQIINELRSARFLQLIAVVRVKTPAPTRADDRFLYRLYRRWDQSKFPSTALLASDSKSLLDQLTTFEGEVRESVRGVALSSADRQTLGALKLDVLLMFGSLPIPSGLEGSARCGVWHHDLGDPVFGDDEPRQFWNTARGIAPLTIYLRASTVGVAPPLVLSQAALQRESTLSTRQNLLGIAGMAQGLMLTKLRQLHILGWDELMPLMPRQPDASTLSVPAGAPTNGQMIGWIVPKVCRQIRHRLRLRNTRESWLVGLRSEMPLTGLPAATTAAGISWLDNPEGRYLADPFLFSHDGRCCLFVEDFDIDGDIGSIACMPIERGRLVGPPRTVLQRPYHLSYPQVFGSDGEIFMIPESGYNNTVELYRAESFPDRWTLERVLFRGPAFDVTLLRDEQGFWFFVTLIERSNRHRSELLLFHSKSLTGDWSLHPASPISQDVRTARCGGAPFLDHGHWIRPAQDGSTTYGEALRYQRILRLDPRHYVEEPAGAVTPAMIPGMTGVHTYNRVGDIEVFDAKRRVQQSST